jgi:hypothetical protein
LEEVKTRAVLANERFKAFQNKEIEAAHFFFQQLLNADAKA